MDHPECERDRLAQSAGLHVDLCRGCGCIHLTIGGVTLRMQRDAALALAGVLRTAELELARRDMEAWSAPHARRWVS